MSQNFFIKIIGAGFLFWTSFFAFTTTAQAQLSTHFAPVASNTPAAQQQAKIAQVHRRFVNEMNNRYNIPSDLSIQYYHTRSRTEGPYYDSDNRAVRMPYRFWSYVVNTLKEVEGDRLSPQQIDVRAQAVVMHTLYHELAHALIDIWQLPITGREETVADEFAALMMLDHFSTGDDVTLMAAEFFETEGMQLEEVSDEDVFANHMLDDQRFFYTVCLVHGSGSTKAKPIMRALNVNWDIQEICVEDTQRRQRAWRLLLAPHRKN